METTITSGLTGEFEAGGKRMFRPLPIILVLAVFCAGALLRMTGLDGKICWYDETYTRMRVCGFSREDLKRVLRQAAEPLPVARLRAFMSSRWRQEAPPPIVELLREDLQMSPAYYWSARAWSTAFGDDARTLRVFSALLGILALPLAYLLAMELFASRRTAFVAACLLAVSPVFVLYSQQIRHYSLWVVVVLLAGFTLLRALRQNSKGSWALYSLALGASLLANPLSSLLAAGHGVFVLLSGRAYPSGSFRRFVIAASIGALVLVPRAVLGSLDLLSARSLDWVRRPLWGGASEYAWRTGMRHWARLFSDSTELTLPGLVVAGLFAALVLAAVAFLIWRGTRVQKLFLLTTVAASLGGLLAQDLLLGGRTATITRYVFPALIAVELAVAFFLCGLIFSPGFGKMVRNSGALMLGGVLLVGLSSSLRLAGEPNSWVGIHDTSAALPQVAAAIDKAEGAVVLVPIDREPCSVLVLADAVRGDCAIVPVTSRTDIWRSAPEKVLGSGGTVFLWKPDERLLDSARSLPAVSLDPGHPEGYLWEFSRRGR